MDNTVKYPKRWALTLGFGLALYGIHWAEQPFLNYLFLPQIGLVVIVFCMFFFYSKYPRKPDFGSKFIWIPMLVIVASIIAGFFINFSMKSLAGAFYGITLFAIYLVSRQLGKAIFIAFIPFVVIVAISCIYNGIVYPGMVTGGIITNYCASAGFMIFGTIVNKFKWQWVLATFVLIALFFTGALEAVFILGVLGITLLIKRDWGKRLLVPVGLVIIAVVFMASFGHWGTLYSSNRNLRILQDIITGQAKINEETTDIITTYRWITIKRAMSDIKPLGHGFTPSIDIEHKPQPKNVHNVPLMVTDQIGPVAGLAWLFITIFCLVKTKWKYAWVAVLAMSMFDHYIWTQFAPYWWCLVGVSTASSIKSDLIFRKAT